MKNTNKAPFAIALGSSIVSGLASTAVQADSMPNTEDNPFALTELSSGYMQTAEADGENQGSMKMKDGACGEGKCGAGMMPGNEEKTVEGKCAGNKPMPSTVKKDMEGKCGEGKCGDSMNMK